MLKIVPKVFQGLESMITVQINRIGPVQVYRTRNPPVGERSFFVGITDSFIDIRNSLIFGRFASVKKNVISVVQQGQYFLFFDESVQVSCSGKRVFGGIRNTWGQCIK